MKKSILISLAALVALAFSCTPEPTLSVSPTTLSAGPEAGSNAVNVSANNAWTAKSSDGWIHISTASGEAGEGRVSFTYDANASSDERTGTITISSASLSQTVTLTQAQADKMIVAGSDQNFGPEGGTFSVKVQSNVSYSVEITGGTDWVTRSTTKGLSESTESFTVAPNEGYDTRTCEITFSGAGTKHTIKVTQGQTDALILDSDAEYTASWKGGVFTVELKSNVGCKAFVVEGESWISRKDTKALEEYQFAFEVDKNEGKKAREGRIEFRDVSGNKTVSVTVIQHSKPYIKVSPESISFEKEGGEATLSVESNTGFTVEIPADADWLSGRPDGDAAYIFTAGENTASATRSATVRIVSDDDEDIFAEVLVVQRGPTQTLRFNFTGQKLTLPTILGANVSGKTNWGDDSSEKNYPSVMNKEYKKQGTYPVTIVFYGGIGVKFTGVTGIDEIDLSSF